MLRRALLLSTATLAACGGEDPDPRPDAALPAGAIQVTAPAGASTSEAGGRAAITVALTAAPVAPVSIAVTSDDPGEGAIATAILRFEAGEVGPRTVEVTGVDDAELDGLQRFHVVFAAAVSDDLRYHDAIAGAVALDNADDDLVDGTLRVFPGGRGAGTVTSTPPGIACPGTCEAPFPAGTTVTLTATAATGSRFGGWAMSGPSDFTPTLALPIASGQRSQASPWFVRDLLGWLTGIDGPASEHLLVIASRGDSVVVGGDLGGPATIAGTMLPHGGARDPLIVALTAAGVPRWSRSFGGSGDASAAAVAILPGGDVIVGGWFAGELALGGTVVTSPSITRGFLARLAAADGAVVWAQEVTTGPTSAIAALAVTDGGDVIACGGGAAPLAWFDGAGAPIATLSPSPLRGCSAIDRRPGGWLVAGWGERIETAAFASIDDSRAVSAARTVMTGGADDVILIDDVVATPGGGGVVAVMLNRGVLNLKTSYLIRVDASGTPTGTAMAGSPDYFGRSMAVVHDGGGMLLVARRRDVWNIVLERWTIAPLARVATYDLEDNTIFNFDLVADGDRRVLAGDAYRTALPGWPLSFLERGGLVTRLQLPPQP